MAGRAILQSGMPRLPLPSASRTPPGRRVTPTRSDPDCPTPSAATDPAHPARPPFDSPSPSNPRPIDNSLRSSPSRLPAPRRLRHSRPTPIDSARRASPTLPDKPFPFPPNHRLPTPSLTRRSTPDLCDDPFQPNPPPPVRRDHPCPTVPARPRPTIQVPTQTTPDFPSPARPIHDPAPTSQACISSRHPDKHPKSPTRPPRRVGLFHPSDAHPKGLSFTPGECYGLSPISVKEICPQPVNVPISKTKGRNSSSVSAYPLNRPTSSASTQQSDSSMRYRPPG